MPRSIVFVRRLISPKNGDTVILAIPQTQVTCCVGAGGSEKKLAAKATAARKLHYTAGMAGFNNK